MAYNNRKQQGFTIVELMIATSIFVTAMVLVLASVVFISRQYLQASNRIALEEASRTVHQQITQSIQFSSLALADSNADSTIDEPTNNGYKAVCVGKNMYIFGDNEPIIDSTDFTAQPEGLFIKENINNCNSADISTINARNLLPKGAKVAYFNITSNGTVVTVFAKSPEDLLAYNSANPENTTCSTVITGREFCATVKLESTATRRVGN